MSEIWTNAGRVVNFLEVWPQGGSRESLVVDIAHWLDLSLEEASDALALVEALR